MSALFTGFNLLLIILGFGMLIFVHELGHFLAAKWAGIRTEAFAVGMGPVALAWRRGIGVVPGSTYKKVVEKTGKAPEKLTDAELEQHGLGETEYSLRWLPLGGFVKMLGQEDANPNYVSDDPRSYNMCPVGKRMVVVSAGVIMNVILAVILFVIAFMVGVRFEAAVVGNVRSGSPAATTVATNAEALGVSGVGLLPGDRVVKIDGDVAKTFSDLQIAMVMSKPGDTVVLDVERDGVEDTLRFEVSPQRDEVSQLRSIGVAPGSSATLYEKLPFEELTLSYELSGLPQAGIVLGSRLHRIGERTISTYGEIQMAAEMSGGVPLETHWTTPDGTAVPFSLPVNPVLSSYQHRTRVPDQGLLGLCPVVRVTDVLPDSPNINSIKAGDLIVRIGTSLFPRDSQLLAALEEAKTDRVRTIPMTVRRGDEDISFDAQLTSDFKLGILKADATDVMLCADPVVEHSRYDPENPTTIQDLPTPVATLALMPGVEIIAVAGTPVSSWIEFRTALQEATAAARRAGEAFTLSLDVRFPTRERPTTTIEVPLPATEIVALHDLAWTADLSSMIFEPVQTVLSADGNPLVAVKMGFDRTHKLIVLTYLTIDRLFRGSVGVEQLRGPVGILHIGTKIADRGFMYLVFFLAMISVNLAVINFLPLPIVDGGLFLFLLYEKLKGRPPSIAFQNAATIIGLCLIGFIVVLTLYNDVLRLIS